MLAPLNNPARRAHGHNKDLRCPRDFFIISCCMALMRSRSWSLLSRSGGPSRAVRHGSGGRLPCWDWPSWPRLSYSSKHLRLGAVISETCGSVESVLCRVRTRTQRRATVPGIRTRSLAFTPPSTLPFFKLFALAPWATASTVFTAMNVLICLSLGFMARRALNAQDGEKLAVLSPAMAALLDGARYPFPIHSHGYGSRPSLLPGDSGLVGGPRGPSAATGPTGLSGHLSGTRQHQGANHAPLYAAVLAPPRPPHLVLPLPHWSGLSARGRGPCRPTAEILGVARRRLYLSTAGEGERQLHVESWR